MTVIRTDIAIIGAGIAGASLAAMIGGRARCVLIEGESQPGYHSTGRSAAFTMSNSCRSSSARS